MARSPEREGDEVTNGARFQSSSSPRRPPHSTIAAPVMQLDHQRLRLIVRFVNQSEELIIGKKADFLHACPQAEQVVQMWEHGGTGFVPATVRSISMP